MNNYPQHLPLPLLRLCACAALEAQGDLARLHPAIGLALDDGGSVNELKEAFSQLYAYTCLLYTSDAADE